jgi:hypothetical protein
MRVAQGRPIASRGKALPSPRSAPQAAAAPGGRRGPDGGVKNAALAVAALHHALAGDRQPLGARRGRSVGGENALAPRGRRWSRVLPPVRRWAVGLCATPLAGRRLAHAEAAAGPRAPHVERVGSSDMLPRLKALGISRGFEFSVTSNRHCLPAGAATAAHRSLGARQAEARVLEPKLDSVRDGSSPDAMIVREPTPGGGARGGGPPSNDAQGRADRHATRRRPQGFRGDRPWPYAARALQRTAGGWPIGRFRERWQESARSR